MKETVSLRKRPPKRSKTLLSDIKYFLLRKAEIPTLITFEDEDERINYNHRIAQRMGIDSNRYSVLNIHKIGIEAPATYIFNELLNWNGESTCWPNHIAKVARIENDLERIQILPFGWKKYPFKFMKSFFGLKIIPLFSLKSIRIKRTPDPFDFDNARYLLYDCSGGYPIGIYSMYVRSSIPEMGETAQCQLIFIVGFNFYGKEDWQKHKRLINNLWEWVHNRVTSNVMNKIKQLGEWRIDLTERNH